MSTMADRSSSLSSKARVGAWLQEEVVTDPHIHIGSDLNLDSAARNMVASVFGMATDLPADVTTGCGLRVPLGSTSRLPERATCLACREYAHRKYLDYADQIERLGPMPGTNITAEQIRLAARTSREIAMKLVEPGNQGPSSDGSRS